MAELLLEARGVSKRFGGILAVNNVDLQLSEREILAVMGPNGAGKTTFFNIVTGIYRPDEGDIFLKSRSLLAFQPYEMARLGMARTFQTIRLFRGMTVLENVLVPQAMPLWEKARHGWSILVGTNDYRLAKQNALRRAHDCLEKVGLLDAADELAGNLPYGQQRRLEIARALAMDPCVLLLDEPAAGMNAQEKEHIKKLIDGLRHESAMGIILIEHDMEMVASLADRVTVLHHGEVLCDGTPHEVRHHPDVIEAYLGDVV